MPASSREALASLEAITQELRDITIANSSRHYPSQASASREASAAQRDGLPLIIVESALCSAVIAPQGAQILEFQPKGQSPLLWLSPRAQFIEGKAIRGGVPVCAPWFGPHATDSSKPQHGFARARSWQLMAASHNHGEIDLHFRLPCDETTLGLHPHPMNLELKMTLGSTLQLALSVENESDSECLPFGWALHSYFPVSNIHETRVTGLPHEVSFPGEVDQLYTQVPAEQYIFQASEQSCIKIQGEQSPSAIVWNPGEAKAEAMADLGGEHYPQFVCVERGAAGSDSWLLKPGEKRSALLTMSRE